MELHQRRHQDCCIQQAAVEGQLGLELVPGLENSTEARICGPKTLLHVHLNGISDSTWAQMTPWRKRQRDARCGRPEADLMVRELAVTTERLVWNVPVAVKIATPGNPT